ncbi:MAG TPA: hypothetical protein VF980_00035 [Thermoanaerobaculia bacterium]
MRYFIAVFLLGPALLAQERPVPPRRVVTVGEGQEVMLLERFAQRLQKIALDVKRDAFIVSEVVKGSGELNDFQKNIAIQKAIDRVDAALKRAHEDPVASQFTLTALDQTKDALEHGREQGSLADLPALQKLMIEKTHVVYMELFRELDQTRRDRQAIVDIQTRLAQINGDLDSAMVDALGSTFEFIRAGGK